MKAYAARGKLVKTLLLGNLLGAVLTCVSLGLAPQAAQAQSLGEAQLKEVNKTRAAFRSGDGSTTGYLTARLTRAVRSGR